MYLMTRNSAWAHEFNNSQTHDSDTYVNCLKKHNPYRAFHGDVVAVRGLASALKTPALFKAAGAQFNQDVPYQDGAEEVGMPDEDEQNSGAQSGKANRGQNTTRSPITKAKTKGKKGDNDESPCAKYLNAKAKTSGCL